MYGHGLEAHLLLDCCVIPDLLWSFMDQELLFYTFTARLDLVRSACETSTFARTRVASSTALYLAKLVQSPRRSDE